MDLRKLVIRVFRGLKPEIRGSSNRNAAFGAGAGDDVVGNVTYLLIFEVKHFSTVIKILLY